jgi:flagellar hook-associated protein FlgK
MSNYSIGLEGFEAARKYMDVIGNNIANAATEGYHRQRIELSPAYMADSGTVILGGGVDVDGITRVVDELMELEIMSQQSSLGEISQELATLQTVESTFGDFGSSTGLATTLDDFFNSLHDLSANPSELIWQSQVSASADVMAQKFRSLSDFFYNLESRIVEESENIVEQINSFVGQIAELNDSISKMVIGGSAANNLCDKRDQLISKLSDLAGVEVISHPYGVVDVSVGSVPVVSGATATLLEIGLQSSGILAYSVSGAHAYNTNLQGGRLGGLLSLRNTLIPNVTNDLNTLASTLIQQINQYHVQGVGSSGSFSTLSGWANVSGDLSDFSGVSAGYTYVRVINTSTGTVTRTAIPVDQDASSDTLSEIASYITSNVANLSASVNSSNQLSITAGTGYKFDFLPAVHSSPTASTLTGASPPTITVSGVYTGTTNDTFEFTISGAGTVGNGTLTLEVKDGGGSGGVITTLNIGSGYAAGDLLSVGNGITIAVGAGDFLAADNFDVAAYGDTDTSGLLSEVGINTFFSGSSASDIAVRSEIANSPSRIATALGSDMTDNANVVKIAGLKDVSISGLNSSTPGAFYRQLITDLGQTISSKQMQQDNIEAILQSLGSRREEISGVDVNEEAANMLAVQQMFQAIAKYLSTIHTSTTYLMQIL